MAIKYHQNRIGNEYGADHQLTNNWNPDLDYGSEYVNVYFRMETKGYGCPYFSFTEEDKKAFDSELVEVFTSLGWKCEKEAYSGSCAIWNKGKQHLYLHPQNFSGEVLKNEVKEIAEALEKRNTFYLRWVDLYETVFDMTDEEHERALSQKDEEIKKAILESCKTTRTSKFYYTSDVVRSLSNKYGIKQIGKEKYSGVTIIHMIKVICELITEGYLVSARDNELIRTINKTEQKQKKIFVA
ncbi:MAG: hypothetical protein HDQ99_02575 [Lachnospiraceae bacterium]|nr:hypothetical protein [Lachnospiraceae bacterium]